MKSLIIKLHMNLTKSHYIVQNDGIDLTFRPENGKTGLTNAKNWGKENGYTEMLLFKGKQTTPKHYDLTPKNYYQLKKSLKPKNESFELDNSNKIQNVVEGEYITGYDIEKLEIENYKVEFNQKTNLVKWSSTKLNYDLPKYYWIYAIPNCYNDGVLTFDIENIEKDYHIKLEIDVTHLKNDLESQKTVYLDALKTIIAEMELEIKEKEDKIEAEFLLDTQLESINF